MECWRHEGHDGGPSSGGAGAAKLRTFVDRIENVLEQSAGGRQEIAAALPAGLNCSISAREAGQRIASVADNRQSILDQLGNLQAPTPQADDVVTLLQRALQQSIEVDRHYRDGFFTVAPNTGCPLPSNPNFVLAADSRRSRDCCKAALRGDVRPARPPLSPTDVVGQRVLTRDGVTRR